MLSPSVEYTRQPSRPGTRCTRAFGFASVKDSTFPEHLSLKNPTMNTLFRDWATPKFALLSICHATSYPSSSNVLRMAANVLPPSCDNNPGTFSSSRYLGFLTAAIRAISKNSVPLASSNPPLFPAIEKSWLSGIQNNQDYPVKRVIPKNKRNAVKRRFHI